MPRKTSQPPVVPPAPTGLQVPIVRANRRELEARLIELRAAVPAAVLAKALGKKAAHRAMTELRRKIADVEFAIAHNGAAAELAAMHDRAAEAAWRAQIHALPPEQIIAGIGKESCCGLCRPGQNGGCVITAGHPHAGSTCGHPLRGDSVFGRDEKGRRQFLYRDNARALSVFDAARRKLHVEA